MAPRRKATPTAGTDLFQALAAANLAFEAWLRGAKAEPRLHTTVSREGVLRLKSTMPEAVGATIDAADRILAHEFDLLGSGRFVPVDPDRPPGTNGYRPIDWSLDPVRNLRFPKDFPHGAWDPAAMRPGNADIKLPWELARCQHWPLLGQAWTLTGDFRYAQEVASQLDDFMAANPVGTGINWTCTMDVALRALNWAIGLQLVRDCPVLEDAFWRRAYGSLFDHGGFIFGNLENKYEVTSNHFLSNVVGLYYLASVFRETREGEPWNAFCRDALEQEMAVQVLPDGADYESSIPYHRLVTELFLGAARLADFRGEPLSEGFRARLKAMVDFLAGTLRPDGLMPQVGDADDGRLHILSRYGTWNPQDARHLFGPAACVLGESRWLVHAGPDGSWETAWWGFDVSGLEFRENDLPDSVRHYPDAGVAVARRGGAYLLITNGVVGTKGFGNHKHNDQLGFELHLGGRPLIVDPGSYVYTSDPTARNLFRGTAYHSTLMIDGVEQNEMNPEWLFRLFESARAETIAFEDLGNEIRYTGHHHGYSRLEHPVVHERTFRYRSGDEALLIMDRLTGRGGHLCRWHFHLAPGVSATPAAPGEVLLESEGGRFLLLAPDEMKLLVSQAWYSPSYGVRKPCLALDLERTIPLSNGHTARFAVLRDAGTLAEARDRIRALWPDLAS